MTSNRDEPLWWLWPVRRKVADAGSDASPRRPWRGPATDPILYPVEFVVVYRLDRITVPQLPIDRTLQRKSQRPTSRADSLYIVNVEVTVMNGNVRGSGGAKTGVICMRPKTARNFLTAGLTQSLELSRRPYRRRAPWPRAHLLQRALRQCQSSTAMPPMLRAWHPTQRWRTMPPSYELLRRFSPELPFGSAMDQQGCHGSRLRRRG